MWVWRLTGGLPLAPAGDRFLGWGTEVEVDLRPVSAGLPLWRLLPLGFQVDSVEKMMEFVAQKGFPVHSGPFEPNPQTKFFFILDPNGVKVQFVELK